MKPSFEVADVLRTALTDYEQRYAISAIQRKAINAILNCRTAVLGGHVDACTQCGLQAISYNSCRHRACPKCQWNAQVRWVRQRMGELLNTPYFHIVFTLPHGLNGLFLSNDVCLYNLLFRCAWETLNQLARQPQWLGAQPGMLAVLHTWGQKLDFHPHLHCIVPGGGMTQDGKWKAAKNGFFIPVRVISTLFRGKFLAALKQLRLENKLEYFGCAESYKNDAQFNALIAQLYRAQWVVYAKAPMSGPQQVLRYLGRYTHRIAISNRRLLKISDGKVTFAYKDRSDQDRNKTLTLDQVEFIRRFMLHVLPQGLHKIRHFGLLAIRNRKTKLPLAQGLLGPVLTHNTNGPSGLVDTETPQPVRQPCHGCGAFSRICVERIPTQIFRAAYRSEQARAPPFIGSHRT